MVKDRRKAGDKPGLVKRQSDFSFDPKSRGVKCWTHREVTDQPEGMEGKAAPDRGSPEREILG
jgi:hypothetical protein